MLHYSSGPLRYSRTSDGGYKLIVEVEKDLAEFYRSLIPKWITVNRQMYPPHISVVRKEVPPKLELWGKHEGEEIKFAYSNHIYNGEVYWWINAFSERLEQVRLELGLPVSSQYTRPPSDRWIRCFHITLANRKGLP